MTESTFKEESLIPEGLNRAPRILIIDDDEDICKLLRFQLKRAGCEVETAHGGEEALRLLKKGKPVDIVLLDLQMPGMGGQETLRGISKTGKVGATIIMTAHATMGDAIQALRNGAYDFITKTSSLDDLRLSIRNALNTVGLKEEVENLRTLLQEQEKGGVLPIGVSRPFQQVMKLVRKVADSNITVLIFGESGSGKELVARSIHSLGVLKQRPFVALNCAAIPENLLESELFGYEKGAFTGATARYVGKFEEAHDGTLFLDEIGELSMGLQAKLLRVLQTQEIQPIGGRLKRVNVRVISATNQHLMQAVDEGRFRADLYYRLAVFPIQVPPLRERMEDIPHLARHFVSRFCSQENKPERRIPPALMEQLKTYPWPGNIRELENAIFRAVVLSEEEVLLEEHFPSVMAYVPPQEQEEEQYIELPARRAAQSGQPPESLPGMTAEGMREPSGAAPVAYSVPPGAFYASSRLEQAAQAYPAGAPTLDEVERDAIEMALNAAGGNMTRAAIRLNIGRATLYRKLKKYGIIRSEEGAPAG
ncbi:MAG: sigma-54 dependent transcriptional regulator [Deltaproteobacteria bacterium]|nr:sigma-54 dependent transcriptional regulator [Deltaproteobacteria bacterium]